MIKFSRKSGRWAHLAGAMSCASVVTMVPITHSVAAEGDGEAASAGLETVTVTAQRREENSQSVPIAIQTVDAENLKLQGALGIHTLSSAVPGLTTAGGQHANMYIRGVGANSASPNNEPSAATYIDGVYMPSSFGLSGFAFNNVEHIEVLKGPQGTLFGRNSTAGVVQIITPDPKQEFGGHAELGYGNYETVSAEGYLTGGLTENLAADLAVLYGDQNDGFGYNTTDGEPTFVRETLSLRSKWLYTPGDTTRIVVAVDYSDFNSDGSNTQALPGPHVVGETFPYPGKFNATGDHTLADAEQYGASLRIEQDFGSLHGVSITGYRNVKGHSIVDNGLPPDTTNETFNNSEYLMQEFQLSNLNPDRVQWLIGAFLYGNEVRGADPRIETGPAVGTYRDVYGVQDTRSYSAFGQTTIEVLTDTKLTLGVRYTDETLEATGRRENLAGQVISGPFTNEIKFDPWTWRVALDHQFTPDVLGYVSWNRGFKSGGYNLSSPGSAPFYPEHVDAYEMGMKSQFSDRVRLNVALFYYDYQDIQVAVVPGGGQGQLFTNAAAARNYGADVSIDYAATDNLTLATGLAFLDAKYTDYDNARGFTQLGVAVPIPDASGQDLPYSPPFSGFVRGDYRVATSVGDFKGTATVSYNDKSYVQASNLLERPSYYLVSASVEWWSASSSPIGVRVWGRNLTDEYYPIQRTESSDGWQQNCAPPRTYGITLLKDF